jgi:hypothetical protein
VEGVSVIEGVSRILYYLADANGWDTEVSSSPETGDNQLQSLQGVSEEDIFCFKEIFVKQNAQHS